jgi:hypothetical protein
MRKLLLGLLITGLLSGCGGDRDRGINRDADRPRSADKQKDKEKTQLAPLPRSAALA